MVVLLQPHRRFQRDTRSALEELLTEACRPWGIIGLGYIALRHDRVYTVGLAGALRASAVDATFARGMLAVLDDEISLIIRGGRPDSA